MEAAIKRVIAVRVVSFFFSLLLSFNFSFHHFHFELNNRQNEEFVNGGLEVR